MSYKTGFYEGRLGIGLGSTMGMGDGNPRYPLDINGDIRLTGSIVNGDGQVLSLVPTESSLWTIGNNNLSYAGGNVGIGTTSPSAKLHIFNQVTTQDTGNSSFPSYDTQVLLKLESGYNFDYDGASGGIHEGGVAIGFHTFNAYDTNTLYQFPFEAARITAVCNNFDGEERKGDLLFLTNHNGAVQMPTDNLNTDYERMRIMWNGNVGIGTTSPGSTLEIKDVTSGTAGEVESILKVNSVSGYHMVSLGTAGPSNYHSGSISIYKTMGATGTTKSVHLSGSTDDTYFNGGGNVGIGTTSPGAKLDILSTASTGESYIEDMFRLTISTSYADAMHGIGWYNTNASRLLGAIRMRVGANYNYPALTFWTGVNGGTPTEKMRIQHDGDVGIGTTNPGYKLHIVNPTLDNSIQDLLCLETHCSSQTTIGPAILFRERWNNGSYWNLARILAMEQSGYGGQLAFFTNLGNTGADDTLLERMRIDENGNVGIGTTSPTQKLHVNGHVAIGAHDSQPTDATVLTDPNNKQNAIIFYNRYYTWAGGSNIEGAPGVRTWHNFISSKYHSTDPYSGSAGYHAFLLWTYCGHHGTADVAMRMGSGNGNSKIWVNGSTTISSDRRIKTNIMDVPDDLALEMVRKIPCRYYEYKRDIYNEYDYQREKPNRTIGFIAQEVKEICPEAVDITEYKIPLDNKIYRDLDIQIDNSKNFIIIKDYSNNDLSANDEVECVINPMNNNNITQDNYKEYIDISDNQTINIKYISGCNFEILDNIDNLVFEEILLKNKKVDDFHTLDKQKLFALNFSATQELDRKVIALESENAELKAELAAIKQHLGI